MTKLWHNVDGQSTVVDTEDHKAVTAEALINAARLLNVMPDEDKYPYAPSDIGWMLRGLVAITAELAKQVTELREELRRRSET